MTLRCLYLKLVCTTTLVAMTAPVMALDVKLDSRRSSVETIHQGRVIKVQRNQNASHQLQGLYAHTAQTCPPTCIQPTQAAAGVVTISEIEVFDFMSGPVITGKGVLVDARVAGDYVLGTIPASLNFPVAALTADAKALADLLYGLGVGRRGKVGGMQRAMEQFGIVGDGGKTASWDFSQAKKLVIWSDGLWSNDAPRLIRGLLELGYPPEKLHYYRGGMQIWLLLGLTVYSEDAL